MTNKERNLHKWDNLASKWVHTGPPASPSNEDIENFSHLLYDGIHGKSGGRVIILGCTPKLRDMFVEIEGLRSCEVVCVDFSSLMYEKTSQATKHKNPNEKFHLSDWLAMDLGLHRFDAVLGDKVIDNVMPDDWNDFFGRLHYHLVPGGYFIVHLAPQNMTFKNLTFTSSLEKWGIYYKRHPGSLEKVVSGFWEEVLGASAFKGETRFHTQKIERFTDEIEKLRSEINHIDPYQREILEEFVKVFWNSRNDEWSSYLYEEILEVMSPYFEHEKTVHSGDYNVASVQPIVRLRAKKI